MTGETRKRYPCTGSAERLVSVVWNSLLGGGEFPAGVYLQDRPPVGRVGHRARGFFAFCQNPKGQLGHAPRHDLAGTPNGPTIETQSQSLCRHHERSRATSSSSEPEHPSDLTDRQWELIAALIPRPHKSKKGGRPRAVDMREVVNTTMFQCRSGCQWDTLPHGLLPKSTVDDYFVRWRDDGTLQKLIAEFSGWWPWVPGARPGLIVGTRLPVSAVDF